MSAGAAAATNHAFEGSVNNEMFLARLKPERGCCETLAISVNMIALVVLIAGIKLCCQADFNYPAVSIGFVASGGGILLLTLALWIIRKIFPPSLPPARREAALRSMVTNTLALIRYMDPNHPSLPQSTKNKTLAAAYREYLENRPITERLIGESRVSELEGELCARIAEQLQIRTGDCTIYFDITLKSIINKYEQQAAQLRVEARRQLNSNGSGPEDNSNVHSEVDVEIQALQIFHQRRLEVGAKADSDP